MSTKLLLAGSLAVALLSSCSSVYKTGQTPDDVYYSPTRQIDAEVKREEKKQEEYTYSKADDNYLRMKVQNRRQWSTIDDRDYWYNYDCNCRCNNNWSTYNRWNNNYDSWSNWNRGNNYYGYNSGWGYGYGYPISYVKSPRSNTGAKPYMSGYTNRTYNNTNNSYSNGKNGSTGSGGGFGNLLKSVFGGTSNSSSSDSYSRPVRTFENNGSSNSSSSSSSSSSSNSSSGRTSTGTTGTGRGGGNP